MIEFASVGDSPLRIKAIWGRMAVCFSPNYPQASHSFFDNLETFENHRLYEKLDIEMVVATTNYDGAYYFVEGRIFARTVYSFVAMDSGEIFKQTHAYCQDIELHPLPRKTILCILPSEEKP